MFIPDRDNDIEFWYHMAGCIGKEFCTLSVRMMGNGVARLLVLGMMHEWRREKLGESE